MTQSQTTPVIPFLFRFRESEVDVDNKPPIASPERGGESNPKEESNPREEEPPKEPTRPTPWGD